jgi:hypothetical protein
LAVKVDQQREAIAEAVELMRTLLAYVRGSGDWTSEDDAAALRWMHKWARDTEESHERDY